MVTRLLFPLIVNEMRAFNGAAGMAFADVIAPIQSVWPGNTLQSDRQTRPSRVSERRHARGVARAGGQRAGDGHGEQHAADRRPGPAAAVWEPLS
jgi:hypothetical protein